MTGPRDDYAPRPTATARSTRPVRHEWESVRPSRQVHTNLLQARIGQRREKVTHRIDSVVRSVDGARSRYQGRLVGGTLSYKGSRAIRAAPGWGATHDATT